jgi:hypothetical protein
MRATLGRRRPLSVLPLLASPRQLHFVEDGAVADRPRAFPHRAQLERPSKTLPRMITGGSPDLSRTFLF